MNNHYQQIESLLSDMTSTFELNNITQFSSPYLSMKLNLPRQEVNNVLKALVNQEKAISIDHNPTLYVYRLTSMQGLDGHYDSIESFLHAYHTSASSQADPFNEIVGSKGSLKSVLNQSVSALCYPKGGLPLLLLGPTGSGKSFLAERLFAYGQRSGIFESSARYLAINCSEYANNPELFLINFFGAVKGAYTGADNEITGMLEIANGGMLFLDEIHCLAASCQEKLFQFMDRGIYHKVGDNEKWHQAQVHLVFATTEDPSKFLLKTLYRRIPVIVRVPALNQRSKYERQALLTHLLKKEAERINCEIYISDRLLSTLVDYDFEENVGQLSNVIKVLIAQKLFKTAKSSSLKLDVVDLTAARINIPFDVPELTSCSDITYFSLAEIEGYGNHLSPIHDLINDVQQIYEDETITQRTKLTRFEKRFMLYEDALSASAQKGKNQRNDEDYINPLTQAMIAKIEEKYDVTISTYDATTAAHVIEDLLNFEQNENQEKLCDAIIQWYTNEYPVEIAMASDFVKLLQTTLDFDANPLSFLIITLLLKLIAHQNFYNETRILVICHGYQTASSLAATVNNMVASHIVDPIDMPIDVSMEAVANQVNRFIENHPHLKSLILFVDMGSLDSLSKSITTNKVDIVTINSVTTSLLLDVTLKVMTPMPLEQIVRFVESIDHPFKVRYDINRAKEPVIVCCCATGMATAERIARLVRDSLPHNIDLAVVEYSYQVLQSEKQNCPLFDKYDVVLIIGTLNPEIDGVPYVALEQLLDMNRNIHLLNTIPFHSNQQRDEFRQNILKNFTLANLLDNLTILNPGKVLNDVEKVVTDLENHLNVKFNGSTLLGLYLHLCCLIERLITDRYIQEYENLNEFEAQHKEFIKMIKHSFEWIEKLYSVKLPLSEIAYIYDYISMYNIDHY